MPVTQILNSAKNVLCPCMRKLCKIRTYDTGNLLEIKHKGSLVFAVDAIIQCIACKKQFSVNANGSPIKEVNFG